MWGKPIRGNAYLPSALLWLLIRSKLDIECHCSANPGYSQARKFRSNRVAITRGVMVGFQASLAVHGLDGPQRRNNTTSLESLHRLLAIWGLDG